MINAMINTRFFLFFLMSNFDVRRYNGSYLSCWYGPRPLKFTTFVDESVEKNKSISSIDWGFKILPKIVRKRLVEQKYIFFVVIYFSCRLISCEVVKLAISLRLTFQVRYR